MPDWMEEAMKALRPWIGRVRNVEDDVGLMAMRRAAGTFNVDPDSIKKGTELPPHWFTLIGVETVQQKEIGPDGHANKGVVLPPIPMPRRMGGSVAGCAPANRQSGRARLSTSFRSRAARATSSC
jgi:3-methylfumaryl-CoA hydratase